MSVEILIPSIWQVKIKCDSAVKICHVDPAHKLKKLCQFILDSFEFDNDHLHQFYISKNGNPYGSQTRKVNSGSTIGSVYPLPEKTHLYLLFDFGDKWVFKIERMNKKVSWNSKAKYPVVIEEKGDNPIQYPNYNELDDPDTPIIDIYRS